MDWNALRDEFPVTRRWAFMDHAAVAPLTARAKRAFAEYAADLAENGDVNERRWVERIEHVRQLAGKLLNADPLDIAFVKNTSEGIGIVAEGFPWKTGDNVVIPTGEYPANVYPWMSLQRRGVELRQISPDPRGSWIDAIAGAIDNRTRIVSFSFVQYATGYRHDLAAIGQLCRERGVYLCVDAIQGLGVFPIDVQALPIDFLAADGHKWLLGPEGAGLFYVRRELVDLLQPINVGWNSVVHARHFTRLEWRLKPHAGRWESGTLNVAGISALGASLELLLDIGIETVRERVLELTEHLCQRLDKSSRMLVYSDRTKEHASGIVSLDLGPDSLDAKLTLCRAQGIIVNRRAGRLRVSPHCYNSIEEIDRLVELLSATRPVC